MRKLQVQGVHHITLTGADRQTSIDFWEGVLGMPFVFDQPNLDNPGEGHLYFDPGDGRLITVFTDEARKPDKRRTPIVPGAVHHLAFNVSRATFSQAIERLEDTVRDLPIDEIEPYRIGRCQSPDQHIEEVAPNCGCVSVLSSLRIVPLDHWYLDAANRRTPIRSTFEDPAVAAGKSFHDWSSPTSGCRYGARTSRITS